MREYTGYGELNNILNMLSELEAPARLRSNDLLRPDEQREYSRGTADAYSFCIHILTNIDKFNK